jgi:hypothetical protein
MRYIAITFLALLPLLAGCAGVGGSASPAFSDEAQCERNGGARRAAHNMCEYQSPGDMR